MDFTTVLFMDYYYPEEFSSRLDYKPDFSFGPVND